MRLIYLSQSFYQKYANCSEILQKPKRPYACLAVRVEGRIFAIPFRHHIRHKYAFITQGTCGLDYTKAVLIKSQSDIDVATPWVDKNDFDAIRGKEQMIANQLCRYIRLYKKALRYKNNPHYANIIQCSSLQYFPELY